MGVGRRNEVVVHGPARVVAPIWMDTAPRFPDRTFDPRRINVQSPRTVLEDVVRDGPDQGLAREDDGLVGGFEGSAPSVPLLGGFGGGGGNWGTNRLTPSR